MQYGDSNWAFMLRQDKEGDKVFHREQANEQGELEWVPTRTNVSEAGCSACSARLELQ